ncbi:hypothetical protein AAVH_06340 [Aphelenchoides avenae]|nr:hypothetical protein AAVH_06340 [Aphelenchus avenae]
MVGRRWRAIANQLSEPLRHVRKVSLEQSRSEAKQSRLTLIVELASGRDLLHKGTLADVAALLNVATRYAFIEYICTTQTLKEEFLQLLSPQFVSEVRVQTVVYSAEFREHEGAADGERFKKFFMSFRLTPNLTVTKAVNFMSDDFLAECAARGVARVHLPSTTRALSNDAVFDFCFAAGDRGRTRSFTLGLGAFGADFIDLVILDSKNPATADPVILIWSVIPQSSQDDQLQAGLRRHAAKLVPCDRSAEIEKTHEVYRWTTTPQHLHIVVHIHQGLMKTYIIARGDVDLPRFSECTCTRVDAS